MDFFLNKQNNVNFYTLLLPKTTLFNGGYIKTYENS